MMERIRSRCSSLIDSGTITLAGIGRLNDYGGTVSQHLGNSGSQLGRVVTGSDYGVGAYFRCVLNHDLKSILARLFAKLGPDRDVAADYGLQRCSQSREDVA